MAFQRDFNELLSEILTAYRNQFGESAITAGSVLFIKSAVTASMHWGLLRALDKLAAQIFVESADRTHKERHAAEFGIATEGLTDAQIVDAVLAAKRSRLSGGNRYDYVAWAREVTLNNEFITYATVVDLAQGEGTFDVVVVSNEATASPEILAKITETLQSRRPIGSGFSWGMRVVSATPQHPAITIQGSGNNWDRTATKAAVIAHVNSLEPGQPLRRSMILAIMHEYGAATADVTNPATDQTPVWNPTAAQYGVYRVSDIVVEELVTI
jgi:uncharacterized phage protein gp47/JayE